MKVTTSKSKSSESFYIAKSFINNKGFIPLYTRNELTDALHDVCSFNTVLKFITRNQMKTIQKKASEDKNTIFSKTVKDRIVPHSVTSVKRQF